MRALSHPIVALAVWAALLPLGLLIDDPGLLLAVLPVLAASAALWTVGPAAAAEIEGPTANGRLAALSPSPR